MSKVFGKDKLIAQLDNLSDLFDDDKIVELAKTSWEIVGDQIRQNALDLRDTGLLLDPRSILVHAGRSKNADGGKIFAEAGVFKDDSAMSDFGLNPLKDMPRSMVAYWLEFGTQDHYNIIGVRARKNPVPEGNSGKTITKGIAPRKFISRAYDAKSEQAFNSLEKGVGAMIDNSVKQ